MKNSEYLHWGVEYVASNLYPIHPTVAKNTVNIQEKIRRLTRKGRPTSSGTLQSKGKNGADTVIDISYMYILCRLRRVTSYMRRKSYTMVQHFDVEL